MGKIEEISNYESEAVQKSNAIMQSKHAERFQRMQERRQARGVSPDYNTFVVNEVEETSLSYVKNVKIIEAYFAEGKVEKEYEEETTEVSHTAVSGDNLTKIANILGVTLEELRQQNNLTSDGVRIGQVFSVTKIEQTEKGENFILTKIENAGIGNEVYIVVKTNKFNAKTLEVNIKQGKEDGVTTKNGIIKVLKEDEEVGKIEIITGEYSKKDYLNKDDFKDLAITKVTLRPKEDSKLKEWNDKLEKLKDKKTYLYLLVDAHTNNSDSEVTYNGTGENEDLLNEFLNKEGEYFELERCLCFAYKIENNQLKGPNVIYTKAGSKVKTGESIDTIKAIVLHRTTGGTTSSGVKHTKGAHFYVDADRDGNDGEIFQAVNLDKIANHVTRVSYRHETDHDDINNTNAIGIEVVGYHYSTNGNGVIVSDYGNDVPDSSKLTKAYSYGQETTKHYWDNLTEKQIQSVVCLVKNLMKEYDLTKEDVLTHEYLQSKTEGEGKAVLEAIKSQL